MDNDNIFTKISLGKQNVCKFLEVEKIILEKLIFFHFILHDII